MKKTGIIKSNEKAWKNFDDIKLMFSLWLGDKSNDTVEDVNIVMEEMLDDMINKLLRMIMIKFISYKN